MSGVYSIHWKWCLLHFISSPLGHSIFVSISLIDLLTFKPKLLRYILLKINITVPLLTLIKFIQESIQIMKVNIKPKFYYYANTLVYLITSFKVQHLFLHLLACIHVVCVDVIQILDPVNFKPLQLQWISNIFTGLLKIIYDLLFFQPKQVLLNLIHFNMVSRFLSTQ